MVAGTRNIGTQATINSAHTHGRIIGKVHTLADKGSEDSHQFQQNFLFFFLIGSNHIEMPFLKLSPHLAQ